MRNGYKSTSCFQNCWFFLMLSYSYQTDPPHPKCDLTPSFLGFAPHSGKNPICRHNDSLILTKKSYVYIVDLRQRQFDTQGCFSSQRLRASGFRTGMSHSPGLHRAVRRAGWRGDMLEFLRTNHTFQLQCKAMMSQLDRVKSKQGRHWLVNLSFSTVETNTEKENTRLLWCRTNLCTETARCNTALCLQIYQVIWFSSWHFT